MNKTKSFLMFSCLSVIISIAVVVTALIYQANEQSSIRTYMFQMDNSPRQRVGTLQFLRNIKPTDLLNKLIHEYVSEYFRVTPLDADVMNRSVLKKLSSTAAFTEWQETEAKTIEQRTQAKMFRLVNFPENSITPLNKPDNYNYEEDPLGVLHYVTYSVQYETVTWTEPNDMDTKPVRESGKLYLRIAFETGIRDNVDVPQKLKEGTNPVELFRFKVDTIQKLDF